MKICYLYLHRLYGRGSGRFLQSLIKHFKERNKLFLVTAMESKLSLLRSVKEYPVFLPYQIPVYQGRSDVKENVKISTIRDTQFFSLIRRFTAKCLSINQEHGLDLIHANHCSVLPYSAYLAREINNVPYVVSAHGTGLLSSKESERNLKIAKIGLENAERIIANSKFTASDIIKTFNIRRSKIRVIYPGIDMREFNSISERKKLYEKKKYNCEGKRIVFCTSYLMDTKGVQDLIKAASIYEKKSKDIVTLITGKGPYREELEKMIRKMKLKRTKMTGWIRKEDLVRLYAAADLCVVPSRWHEPFGMVSLEAMASETPIIATDVGGIPEVVTDDTGVLIDPKNPRELSKAVLNHIFDDDWLKEKGENGRRRVKRKFSQTVTGREMEKVCKKAAS